MLHAPDDYASLVGVLAPPEAPEDRDDFVREREHEVGKWAAEDSRRSVALFLQVVWPVIRGAQRLIMSPHVPALCDEAQAAAEEWMLANRRVPLTRVDDRGVERPYPRYQEMLERSEARWAAHGLERVDGELLCQNLIVNAAPGSIKSIVWMVVLPAWVWLHDPTCTFGCASVADANVQRDARECRDIVESPIYRATFGVTWAVRDDTNAVGRWILDTGGARVSRTMQVSFVGQHVDIMLIDDPDDSKRVWSDTTRRATHEQYSTQMENRVNHEPLCLRVVVQQRVHVDDLSGYLLAILRWSPRERAGWGHFCIPTTWGRAPDWAPERSPHGTSARFGRQAGHVMQPERYTPRVLADKRRKLLDGYDGQYEQNPQRLDGGLLKRAAAQWFVVEGTDPSALRERPPGCAPRTGEDALPPIVVQLREDGALDFEDIAISVDCSNGSETVSASGVGITVHGIRNSGGQAFWIDDDTAVMGPEEQEQRIEAMLVKWSPQCTRMYIEAKALGHAVAVKLRRRLAEGKVRDSKGHLVSCEIVEVKVPGGEGKTIRCRSHAAPRWANGQWYVLDGAPWLYPRPEAGDSTGALAEVCAFPFAKRKDRVDTLSQLAAVLDEDPTASDQARALAMCEL